MFHKNPNFFRAPIGHSVRQVWYPATSKIEVERYKSSHLAISILLKKEHNKIKINSRILITFNLLYQYEWTTCAYYVLQQVHTTCTSLM